MKQSLTDSYVLSNGVTIPCIGFGTWQTPNGEVAVSSVQHAIQSGYRHIDTAEAYRNEASVGEGIKRSGIDRGSLFLTSKLSTKEHGYDTAIAAFEESLHKLGTDYLDMFLIHWPNPINVRSCWEEKLAETWKAFEDLYAAGKIRAIGISNFHPRHMDVLLKTAKVLPMVNQIRLCPGDTADEIVDYCRAKNILLEAYSPLGTGKIFEVPEMKALAEKYGKTVAQICIRWSLQRGYLPLPKSVTPSRIEENTKVFDFALSDEDVELIANLKGCVGYANNPDTITW